MRDPLEDLRVGAEAERVEAVVAREGAVEVGRGGVSCFLFCFFVFFLKKEKREGVEKKMETRFWVTTTTTEKKKASSGKAKGKTKKGRIFFLLFPPRTLLESIPQRLVRQPTREPEGPLRSGGLGADVAALKLKGKKVENLELISESEARGGSGEREDRA